MKLLIFILVPLAFFQSSFAQGTSYKDSVITIFKQTSKGVKIFKDKDKDGRRVYFYHKKTRKIVSLLFFTNNPHSILEYKFINEELIYIRIILPYDSIPGGGKKKMYGTYLFKGNSLVEKDELNFPKGNIEQYKIQGIELFRRAEQFFRNKGLY